LFLGISGKIFKKFHALSCVFLAVLQWTVNGSKKRTPPVAVPFLYQVSRACDYFLILTFFFAEYAE
jgi:hypothetical protein